MSPTITSPAMTQAGMILGTAAYMSPEQARGKPVDKRADIWAFGGVLYEMLTGTRAFEGDDVSDTLARVVKREPDWSALPARVPPPGTPASVSCIEGPRPDAQTIALRARRRGSRPFESAAADQRWPTAPAAGLADRVASFGLRRWSSAACCAGGVA